MPQELIHTSARKGIKAGSCGFCTVAYTEGMAANLVSILEAYSVYMPLFDVAGDKALLNPTSFIHYRCSVGAQSLSIISRISFAGLDYTNRSNRVAHHLVLDQEDLPAAGPAAFIRIFDQKSYFERSWDRDPELLPHGLLNGRVAEVKEEAISRSGRASAWDEFAGDAGWAGALAESFLADRTRPSFIVFDPELHRSCDLLLLVEEALSFLPPQERWQVTFNTHFSALPQGTRCVWRCCTRNSDALKEARRTPGALVVDLSDRTRKADGGTLVQAARTGEMPRQEAAATHVTHKDLTQLAKEIQKLSEKEPKARHDSITPDSSIEMDSGSKAGSSAKSTVGAHSGGKSRHRSAGQPAGDQRKSHAAAISACVLILAAIAFCLWILNEHRKMQTALAGTGKDTLGEKHTTELREAIEMPKPKLAEPPKEAPSNIVKPHGQEKPEPPPQHPPKEIIEPVVTAKPAKTVETPSHPASEKPEAGETPPTPPSKQPPKPAARPGEGIKDFWFRWQEGIRDIGDKAEMQIPGVPADAKISIKLKDKCTNGAEIKDNGSPRPVLSNILGMDKETRIPFRKDSASFRISRDGILTVELTDDARKFNEPQTLLSENIKEIVAGSISCCTEYKPPLPDGTGTFVNLATSDRLSKQPEENFDDIDLLKFEFKPGKIDKAVLDRTDGFAFRLRLGSTVFPRTTLSLQDIHALLPPPDTAPPGKEIPEFKDISSSRKSLISKAAEIYTELNIPEAARKSFLIPEETVGQLVEKKLEDTDKMPDKTNGEKDIKNQKITSLNKIRNEKWPKYAEARDEYLSGRAHFLKALPDRVKDFLSERLPDFRLEIIERKDKEEILHKTVVFE